VQSWGATGCIGAAIIIGTPVVLGPDIKRKIASGIEPIWPLIDIGPGIFTMKVRRPRQGQCLSLGTKRTCPAALTKAAIGGKADVAAAHPEVRN
jgi:hypothetical protein